MMSVNCNDPHHDQNWRANFEARCEEIHRQARPKGRLVTSGGLSLFLPADSHW